MNIPRYWARSNLRRDPTGRPIATWSWQWSDVSVADAQRIADQRALELAQMLDAGVPLDHYAYGQRPLREEIVQVLEANVAIITRNLYGALVLNSSNAMFIDVDFAPASGSSGGLFRRMFGKAASASAGEPELARIRQWAGGRPDLGMRIYRTRAGLRCLITNRTFDPVAPESLDLQRQVGADPLYIRLCEAQASFRARLTPKPWRCGIRQPPTHYPWLTLEAESRFRRWHAEYEKLSLEYNVCQFIEHIGRTDVHPGVRPIVALHDQFACARPTRPLA